MAPLGSDMAADYPLQLVENHLSALRRLAQKLVGDPNDAEDAVQETWLVAMQSRPSGMDRLRGWLETTLRNVVRRRYRQEKRTQRREQTAARSETVQPAVDIVMWQQQLSALTDSIRELPVELQECVFLRYFEGLPPRQIAAQTGQPVVRVYRSLERAKIQLRRALEERDQSWRKGLALLIGLRPTAATLAVGGWIILSKKLAALCGLSLLLLLSYLAGLFGEPELGTSAVAGGGGELLRTEAPVEETVEETVGAEVRESSDPTPGDVPEASGLNALAPYLYELEIHARTEEDLPGAGVAIHLAPEFHILNRGTTDDQGVLRVQFKGRAREMTMVIACPSDDSSGTRLRRLSLVAGTPAKTVVRVKGSRPVAGISLLRMSYEASASGYTNAKVRSFNSRSGGGAPALHRDADGVSWFTAGRGVTGEKRAEEYLRRTYLKSRLIEYERRMSVDLELTSKSGTGAARKRVLTGTVRDAGGRPVKEALVLASNGARAKTNAAGEFRLEFRAKDGSRVEIRAGGGNHGLANFGLETRDRLEFTWDAQLDRGIEFRGKLVDADGKPLTGWRIEIQPEDGEPWIDGAKTNKGGVFAIPNVQDRVYRVRAFGPKAVLSSFRESGFRPLGIHTLPVVTANVTGTFRVAPRTVDGKAVAQADVRLWNESTGEGRIVRLGKKPTKLVAGSYRMVIGAQGFETKDIARIRVDRDQLTDFGIVDVGEKCVLDLRPEGGAPDEKLVLFGFHPAVPTRVHGGKNRRVELPPGRYRALRKDLDDEFEVGPGQNLLPPTRE